MILAQLMELIEHKLCFFTYAASRKTSLIGMSKSSDVPSTMKRSTYLVKSNIELITTLLIVLQIPNFQEQVKLEIERAV